MSQQDTHWEEKKYILKATMCKSTDKNVKKIFGVGHPCSRQTESIIMNCHVKDIKTCHTPVV